ncbi:MAG: molybdopterin-guanine dinucleotide biosynthesis protein B [Desulfotomaculaceae bacterium]|nr:molybdopterin-guanine dinucleotide biosynthesis protein B [Desulfotomaculaceae bacterium]
MKAFSVFGVTQSGKTTTIENIIRELKKRGYSVGSVKNIHYEDFLIDVEGSNTWRHKQAGSEMIVARGFKETDILIPQRLGIDRILRYFDHDYVVIEGVSDTVLPKILCGGSNFTETDARLNDLVFAISGCISNQISEYQGFPVINSLSEAGKLVDLIEEKVTDIMPFVEGLEQCGACGSNCRELVTKIIKGEATRSDCAFVKSRTTVTVGQKEIAVDSWLEAKLEAFLAVLFSKLDSYDPGEQIKITVRK